MSFTFVLGGVTHIVMVRKIPWKSQVAVLFEGLEWHYDYEAKAPRVILLPSKNPPPPPALEEKIIQMLKLYFAPAQ